MLRLLNLTIATDEKKIFIRIFKVNFFIQIDLFEDIIRLMNLNEDRSESIQFKNSKILIHQ